MDAIQKLQFKKIIIIPLIITLSLVIEQSYTCLVANSVSNTIIPYRNKHTKEFVRNKFLSTQSPIIINSDRDFESYNFTGKGTIESPYLIQHLNITTNESTAIYITNTTKYFNIENCYIRANKRGITLNSIKQSTAKITHNTIVSNIDVGVYVIHSLGVKIESNLIADNGIGILCFFGSRSIIKNNTIIENTKEGIKLEFTDSSLFVYNNISKNGDYGVFVVQTSDYNQIHHNWFIDNYGDNTSQARDDGRSNMWYLVYTLEGNYWSDWNKTGAYYIDGNARAVDRYPLDINGKRTQNSIQSENETEFVKQYYYLIIFTLLTSAIMRKRTKKKRTRD